MSSDGRATGRRNISQIVGLETTSSHGRQTFQKLIAETSIHHDTNRQPWMPTTQLMSKHNEQLKHHHPGLRHSVNHKLEVSNLILNQCLEQPISRQRQSIIFLATALLSARNKRCSSPHLPVRNLLNSPAAISSGTR